MIGNPLGCSRGMKKLAPKTCREAAHRLMETSSRANAVSTQIRLEAVAETMEAFGEAPVPPSLLDAYDWERI